jgi:hypothetical protein
MATYLIEADRSRRGGRAPLSRRYRAEGGICGSTETFDHSAELYDPATGTFSPTGAETIGGEISATLLPDGRVLVAGSESNDSYLAGPNSTTRRRESWGGSDGRTVNEFTIEHVCECERGHPGELGR